MFAKRWHILGRLSAVLMLTICSGAWAQSATDVSLEGGDGTVDDTSGKAFDHALANIADAEILSRHDAGETGFLRNFAKVRVGGKIRLGPKFNNVSCVGCHVGSGRGLAGVGQRTSSSVVKISRTRGAPLVPGGPIPLRSMGLQVRDHAVKDSNADARVKISWETINGAYGDGIPYQLRRPTISLRTAKGTKLPVDLMMSLRRSPPVFGAGLLEAVSDSTLLALAAANNDSRVSGKPNVVWNLKTNSTSIGRFGFKGAAPSLEQQIAAAYANDMGVTSPLIMLNSRKPEISQETFDATMFYTQTLAVPRARDQNQPDVARGNELFTNIGCASCHVPTLTTGASPVAALSNQTIHPFTDLLLHDMGPGLADNRPEFLASGSEWRTTPLWGIGLTDTVLPDGKATYLHDGRARSVEEAILWHDGEAADAAAAFRALEQSERAKLIAFLRSL